MTAPHNGTANMPAYTGRKTALTTGQVAGILGCAPRTVSKAFDRGELAGWRLPPPGHDRRFDPRVVIAYCRARGIPHDPAAILQAAARRPTAVGCVLVLGDPDLAAALAALPESATWPGWAVESAADGFDAGQMADRVWPACVVAVAGAQRAAVLDVAGRLRRMPWGGGAAWLLLDTEDRAGLNAMDHGFDLVLFGEVGAEVVAECVRRAAAGEGAA